MKKYREHIFILIILCLPIVCYGQRDCNLTSKSRSSFPNLNFRTNLATWVILAPSFGVEYRASDRIGLLLDTNLIQLDLDRTKYRYWRIWGVAPQVRYYLSRNLNNYIGLQYSLGSYSVSKKQGDFQGVGMTVGHQFSLAKRLLFDMGLSLGYLRLYNTERFERIDGVNYLIGERYTSDYYGLSGISMSLVWKLY